MSNEETAQAGQAPADATGQAPSPTSPTLSHADALEALQAARREAAETRTKLKALERAQQEAENAKLSDLEKATKRTRELEAELDLERQERRDRINRYEVQLAASKLGIVDPEAAVALLDWSRVEYDDDGSPKHIDRALKALLEKKPYLAGNQSSGAATNPARGANSGSGPDLTLADIRGKSPEWINRNWPRVAAAMRRGV